MEEKQLTMFDLLAEMGGDSPAPTPEGKAVAVHLDASSECYGEQGSYNVFGSAILTIDPQAFTPDGRFLYETFDTLRWYIDRANAGIDQAVDTRETIHVYGGRIASESDREKENVYPLYDGTLLFWKMDEYRHPTSEYFWTVPAADVYKASMADDPAI